MNLTPIDWGGDIEFIGVSARTGEGVEGLLENILIQAELLDLKADPTAKAKATPLTVPGAPTAVSAVAGNSQATISFIAPASNGGTAITGYTVTSSPGNLTASGTTSPITITGLTNLTTYTFTVKATNAIGSSLASDASSSVIPSAAPTNIAQIGRASCRERVCQYV